MATSRPRPGGSGEVLRRAPARQPAQSAPAAPPPEVERYAWEHTVVPPVRRLSRRDMTQTTLALCGVLGLFAATALLLIVISLIQLDGTERIEGAVLCVAIAALLIGLIGYVVAVPLDPQRGPRRR